MDYTLTANDERPGIMKMVMREIIPSSPEMLQAYVSSGGEPANSDKVEGIRRIWHEDKSENFQLEACLAAVMKAAGEPPEYNTALFEAISGTLFAQVYNFDGNHGITAVLGHELMPYIWDQIGYSYFYIDRATIINRYDLVMAVIKTAVSKGIPTISSDIGNIQLSNGILEYHREWCNIGGYDEGDILYVNAFPEELPVDEHGYCTVKSGGLSKSSGLYILNKKLRETNIKDICRKAIKAIPAVISLPSYKGISFGQQAYYDWADELLDDRNMVNLSDDPYKGFLWQGHHAPWINALTCEAHMRFFYNRIAELSGLPEAPKVKEIYAKIYHKIMDIQKLHGGKFFASVNVISKRDVREEIAAVLRHMGDMHNELLALLA